MMAEKASRTPGRPKPDIDPPYVLRITGVLLGVCLAVALLLGIVNQVTKPRIDAIQAEKIRAAMSQVLPADSYEPLDFTAANVTAIYQAVSDGKDTGWVVETSAAGSWILTAGLRACPSSSTARPPISAPRLLATRPFWTALPA